MSFEELLGADWLPGAGVSAAGSGEPELENAHPSNRGKVVRQLSLIRGGSERDWELEEATKRVGRRGIAAARAILHEVSPLDVYGETSAA